jgi:hypothetical protein
VRPALLFVLCAVPAFAQDAGVQQQILHRQQATDAFNLQMKQSQEALKAAPAERPALDARQLSERQRLDNVSEQQQRDVQANTPQSLRPYELQRADMERQPFRGPVVVVPVKSAPKTEPILPPQDGIKLDTPR